MGCAVCLCRRWREPVWIGSLPYYLRISSVKLLFLRDDAMIGFVDARFRNFSGVDELINNVRSFFTDVHCEIHVITETKQINAGFDGVLNRRFETIMTGNGFH